MIEVPADATAYAILFTVHDPITGEACDADSLPTVAFRYTDGSTSGVATEVAGTVARISTGLYALSVSMAAYYSSPGGAGDYAEASTNVAARVVFPGTSEDPWTISRWLTVPSLATTLGTAMGVRRTSGDPALSLYVSGTDNDGQVTHTVIDGTNGAEIVDAIPALAAACHLALTFDGTTVTTYANGAAVGSSAGSPGALAWGGAGDTLTLMSDATHADPLAGDVRNIMLVDRALTAGEVAALYAAGPTHHPLMPAGVWAGGQSIPVIWCTPAVGGVVANSGDGGTCGLVLNGAVRSLTGPAPGQVVTPIITAIIGGVTQTAPLESFTAAPPFIWGTVVADGSNAATAFEVSGNFTDQTDQLKESLIVFIDGTLAGQMRPATAYDATTNFVTVGQGGFTATPTAGDRFLVVYR